MFCSKALATINTQLGVLTSGLSHDKDIQVAVGDIVGNVVTCVNQYGQALSREGSTVIAQQQLLVTTETVSEVNVAKLNTSLHSLTKKIEAIRNEVLSIEKNVNANIEDTRSRRRQHGSRVEEAERKVSQMEKELKDLESEIGSCETDQRNFEQSANELDNHVGNLRREADKKRALGGLGIFAAVMGVIAAPFTGIILFIIVLTNKGEDGVTAAADEDDDDGDCCGVYGNDTHDDSNTTDNTISDNDSDIRVMFITLSPICLCFRMYTYQSSVLYFYVIQAGLSLTLTAAGATMGAINLKDADECSDRAGRFRNDASSRRHDAEQLRDKRNEKSGKMTSMRQEIVQLKTEICKLHCRRGFVYSLPVILK